MPYDPSPEALGILTDTYWTSGEWRRPKAWPAPELLQVAVAAGVMFDSHRSDDHDGWIAAARAAAAPLSALEVGEAFLASLTSRRLDLRSALGSYAVARFLPDHPFEAPPHLSRCQLCGQYQQPETEAREMNVLNFERFRWGGVRRDDIEYLAFDLEQFALAPRLRPTRADVELGQELIDQLRRLPAGTTAARALAHLKMIKGNKDQRQVLIGILGVCGILGTAGHPGYATAFVRSCDRVQPRGGSEQAYPACWWTAVDGVNAEALREFLPQLS